MIYERSNGVITSHLTSHNSIPRWIVGGEPKAVAEAMGIIDYDEWKDIMIASEKHKILQKHIQKLKEIYYIVKDDK